MQNNYNKDEVVYAGFFVRLAAYLIDSIILFVGLLFVRIILWAVMAAGSKTGLGGNILFHYNLKDIILYLLEAVYYIVLTYHTGTTIGKRIMNLRVVSCNENESPTLFAIIYRETIGKFISGVILGIGYLMIGIDKECRGLHDIFADTRVIYAKKVSTIYDTSVPAYVGDYTYQSPKDTSEVFEEHSEGSYEYGETAESKEIEEPAESREIEEQSSSASPWDAPL